MVLSSIFSATPLLLIITIIIVAISIQRSTNLSKTKRRLPPGPPAIPIIGHLHLIRSLPHHAFDKLAARYGPLMHLRLGSVLAIVASSPDMAKEVLKTNDANFASRPQNLASRTFGHDGSGLVFAPYGPYWKWIRKLCMSELLGSRTVDTLLPMRRLGLHELLRTLLDASQRRQEVNVSGELVKMGIGTVGRSLVGSTSFREYYYGGDNDDDDLEEMMNLTKEVNMLVGSFNVSDFIPALGRWDLQGLDKKIRDVHQRFDAMLERIIARKQNHLIKSRSNNNNDNNNIKDLLDIMLDIADDHHDSDIKLTRENIKSFALEVLVAGSDSSAASVEWTLAELMQHPEMLERAKSEIEEVVGKDRIVEESDIPKLPYLQAIVKETLRLHPAAAFALRLCINDARIKDYDIPAGSHMFVNLWALGRDPSYWQDPLEFKPERFLLIDNSDNNHEEEEEEMKMVDFRGQYYHYLPFGSGRRVCPGMNLALQVVQATLAALIQCFEWGPEKKVMDMAEGIGIVIPRAHPIICVPVSRLDPLPSLDTIHSYIRA
ncbi:putative 3,9-dihydroxypterocarpan 6A-monooxygenase [Dioscorea sansibarensis]